MRNLVVPSSLFSIYFEFYQNLLLTSYWSPSSWTSKSVRILELNRKFCLLQLQRTYQKCDLNALLSSGARWQAKGVSKWKCMFFCIQSCWSLWSWNMIYKCGLMIRCKSQLWRQLSSPAAMAALALASSRHSSGCSLSGRGPGSSGAAVLQPCGAAFNSSCCLRQRLNVACNQRCLWKKSLP